MNISYWLLLGTVFAFAAIILAGDLWWANRLRVAREQRDEAVSEAARQAVIADTWRAIAEGRDVLAKVERGAM